MTTSIETSINQNHGVNNLKSSPTPTTSPTNTNTNTTSATTRNKRKTCYSRAHLQAIGAAVLNTSMGGSVGVGASSGVGAGVAAPPPASGVTVAAIEAVLAACPDIVRDSCYEVLRREQVRRERQFSHECSTCSLFDMSSDDIQRGIVRAPPAGACATMQELIKNSLKECRSAARGLTFLCQSPDVVFGQLRVAVAFDPRRAPKKLREMPPRCVDRIRGFVCGAGFHFPAPAQGDAAAWTKFAHALKFDAIMDNQTPLFAGLGKFWKRHHTPFEKFVQILFWRDERPNPANFGMISKNQMPVIVACLSGDIDAAVMLMHLRFFVLVDDLLFGFPFMANLDPLKAAVLRHLIRYFYRKQTERALAQRGF